MAVAEVVAVSSSEEPGAVSRPTNEPNSVTASEGGDAAVSETASPEPSEVASEFVDEYPERSRRRLTERDGTKIRRELTTERTVEWSSEPPNEWERAKKGSEVVRRSALTWEAAVEEVVRSHQETEATTLNFTRGKEGEAEYVEWSKQASSRWSVSAQKKRFAQLKGWFREVTGGERPSGGRSEAAFEEPHVVLLGRTASGREMAPADHQTALRDSWQPVYQTLRNTLRAEGYTLGEDWQYVRMTEPHDGKRGGGINACYDHEHPVIVVDGEVSPSDFRSVMEKHVEETEGAEMEAHRNRACPKHDQGNPWDDAVGECEECDTSVTVKPAEEAEDVAAYVAGYVSVEPKPFEERSVEYKAWAATKHATNSRTMTRSVSARAATKADRCKQRAESPESDQERDHGEEIVRAASNARHSYECAECGSAWEVEQDHDTLVSARRATTEAAQAVADGGEVDREGELRSRWPSARSAATVGETPQEREARRRIQRRLERDPAVSKERVVGEVAMSGVDVPPEEVKRIHREVVEGVDRESVVGFERPPGWELESVTVEGEEYDAGDGGGVDMAEVELPAERLLAETCLGEGGMWRCAKTEVSGAASTVARHLAGLGVTEPEVVESVVERPHG